MSFGLTNATKTFMDLMNRVFQSYLDSFVIILIDDIFVYSIKEGEHLYYLRMLIQMLQKNQLISKYRICEFLLRSVAFLGNIIFSEGVLVYLRKT